MNLKVSSESIRSPKDQSKLQRLSGLTSQVLQV